jgi:acetyl/propionyl-CoA carboxylase alpha subunit
MLAKLVVWGETRHQAMAGMVTALQETRISGASHCQITKDHSPIGR